MFTKVLIANRGEIALRVLRACRELGIVTAAVYSDADRSALHVRSADEAYHIGPAPAVDSYLRVEAIVEAALRSGAQAIHPGYGFLSENAGLARACAAAGIVFVGPPAEAIDLMGSKIAAKRLAVAAGVPVVPGYDGEDQDPARLAAEADAIGYPLLIKASAGGGGKGMRAVERAQDFASALEGARREARAAFGDDSILLERLILRPRHIEIQVLADSHGQIIHLGERECSIQRRHQKVVEEAPSPALTPELRQEMGAAAIRVAQAASYQNAGTLEFMLDDQGRYYFLEMNTRLQVEHPVTEQVTGLDLVRLQLRIAAGDPLPLSQEQVMVRGHAIEVRLYAEDPRTYLPASGPVELFAPPQGPGVRLDAGVESGDEVTVHYDPMLAKLIVSAPERTATVERLRRALDDFTVLGLTTNLPLLRAIAHHQAFLAGATHTGFLEEHQLGAALEERAELPEEVLAALALRQVSGASAGARAGGGLEPPGPWAGGPWRAARQGRTLRYHWGERAYPLTVTPHETGWAVARDGRERLVELIAERGPELVLREGARLLRVYVVERGAEILVGYAGRGYRLARDRGLSIDAWGHGGAGHGHAGGLRAPMPGTLVKVLVEEGQQVEAGAALVVLEAMKMEHTIVAPHAGTVRRVAFAAGQLVPADAVLVEIEST